MNRNRIFRSGRHQAGQGMTEYIIIVALIAIAAIGVFSMFGKTVRNQAAGLAKELSGNKADTAIQQAGTAAQSAQTRANTDKGMKEYNKDNDAK
ncbi:pilus assembly protein [Thermomonas brevis]|jgi:Flp pilus assembly pilin Flp